MAHWGLSHHKKKGITGLVTFCVRSVSKTRCLKKGRGNGKSEGKTRKKTYAATG